MERRLVGWLLELYVLTIFKFISGYKWRGGWLVGCWNLTTWQHLRSYQAVSGEMVGLLLELCVLATSKAVSACHCAILLMWNAKLTRDKYQFYKSLV